MLKTGVKVSELSFRLSKVQEGPGEHTPPPTPWQTPHPLGRVALMLLTIVESGDWVRIEPGPIPLGYSYRSASMGLSREALLAG